MEVINVKYNPYTDTKITIKTPTVERSIRCKELSRRKEFDTMTGRSVLSGNRRFITRDLKKDELQPDDIVIVDANERKVQGAVDYQPIKNNNTRRGIRIYDTTFEIND